MNGPDPIVIPPEPVGAPPVWPVAPPPPLVNPKPPPLVNPFTGQPSSAIPPGYLQQPPFVWSTPIVVGPPWKPIIPPNWPPNTPVTIQGQLAQMLNAANAAQHGIQLPPQSQGSSILNPAWWQNWPHSIHGTLPWNPNSSWNLRPWHTHVPFDPLGPLHHRPFWNGHWSEGLIITIE